MTVAQIKIPAKLVPVFEGEADVRGSHGGRGSAKTRTFAKMTAVRAHMWDVAGREGIILCARQFMNSLADSSLEEIKAAIRDEPWLAEHFDIGETYIRTKSGRISYSFVGLARNLNSIKSKSRILLAWVEEAEPVTEEAWVKLIPTLREEDSELWITWNPERKKSATNKRFHPACNDNDDPRVKIVEMNWRDNPWFPDILNRVRLKDQVERPDQYQHIWEGDFITFAEGAYYAAQLNVAKERGRIGQLDPDPLMTLWAVWDIGGTGAKADATSIWIVQFIGEAVWLLDYYEAKGQPLATHVNWLRESGYEKAHCVLPHDGAAHEKVAKTTYEGALREAGFETIVIPNQGAGAAMRRVEAARRLFPQMYFDAEYCEAGIEAIGWYHEKQDEERGVGLGPNHDWSSHGADAFGLIAVARPIILNIPDNDNDDWDERQGGRSSVTGY
ncbi:PBSX family phage terminase large subunit [Sphingopyxis sp. JAI128]|uniref:PBSX family phage terminase large subunit n=1 Tax=Sphingopyxis sp. JAI128 TaxID=2723066 RepID=UPI001810DE95|nr:phage terminase large subunit [Sphingopyxis sp. JAI128]MBB6424961.1 phage terminase large subunit [Sphingopyxis sp. JAI128]